MSVSWLAWARWTLAVTVCLLECLCRTLSCSMSPAVAYCQADGQEWQRLCSVPRSSSSLICSWWWQIPTRWPSRHWIRGVKERDTNWQSAMLAVAVPLSSIASQCLSSPPPMSDPPCSRLRSHVVVSFQRIVLHWFRHVASYLLHRGRSEVRAYDSSGNLWPRAKLGARSCLLAFTC